MSGFSTFAVIRRLATRFDRLALDQLRVVASRLEADNEDLRERLAYAESAADSWRDDALRLMEADCERTGAAPGITKDGALVVVPAPKHGDVAAPGLHYVLCQVATSGRGEGWLYIPHADGQYVSAAMLPAFSLEILRVVLAELEVQP
jgi:hypothetical protein